jgi:hypothetical protein
LTSSKKPEAAEIKYSLRLNHIGRAKGYHLQKLSGLYQGSYTLDGSENHPFERPHEASERNIPYT